MNVTICVNDKFITIDMEAHMHNFDSFIDDVYDKTGREIPIDFEKDVVFYNSVVKSIDDAEQYLNQKPNSR